LYSCNDVNDPNKQKTGTVSGDIMAYEIEYTVEFSNKTNKTVTLYEPAFFYLGLQNNDVAPNAKPDIKLCEINGEDKKACKFTVSIKPSLYGSDNASQPIPDAEALKAQFVPYIGSFFLRVNVGGSDRYLAGWPPSYNSKTSMPPPSKIVQNDIGWAENTAEQIRIKNNNFAYVPFIVKYDSKSKDFDDAITVKAQAELTVNSADDIRFETTSLSRSS
jgi:hypothetical protein